MLRQIGPTEILLILAVVMLLFGGRKLPELARGSGRALRIFKSEVQDLNTEDTQATTDSGNPEKNPTQATQAQDTQQSPATAHSVQRIESSGTTSGNPGETRPGQS